MQDQRRSVLLVEDEALIRMMLAGEFEDGGFEVHEAGSADKAVALLEAGLEVTAVVTDVRMPGSMDGLGLTAWLADRRPGLPVVIISGYVAASEAVGLNPAVVAVLSKPYNPIDIVTLVSGPVFGGSVEP
ncbi:response regulator [Rubellimicrobium rubrum]|nr:response regulator [Rubellimicrobium rubrum]